MATILIVDDDHNTRTFIKMVLPAHYHFVEAENGQEGLHMFALHQPDLIISDLNMPIMNGLEFVTNLRAATRNIKVIAISSSFLHKEDYEEIAMRNAGADICLAKPIDRAGLRTAVGDLLLSLPPTTPMET